MKLDNIFDNVDFSEKAVLTVQELAIYMRIGANAAYGLTRIKGFPVITIGKRKVIPKVALDKWLSEAGQRNANG